MSKKKNTLNDLEEFLKLQASTLVTPSTLSEKVKGEPAPKAAPAHVQVAPPPVADLNEADILQAVQQLSASDKKRFYNLIIKATENLPNRSKEDSLLINTALYLKGGMNWKDVIRDYWKNSD